MGNLPSEAAKYAAASAVALLADTGLMRALTRYAGWDYRFAAAVSRPVLTMVTSRENTIPAI